MEPGSRVGGEGFDSTERPDKTAFGWGVGGRGDRKASISPQVTCITCGSRSSVTGWEGWNDGGMALKTAMAEVCQCFPEARKECKVD